jgi:hypothetical protein
MVLEIWVGTFFQEELHEVEVGYVSPGACTVQGSFAVWDRYSVDVGAVFNELFCKDELIFMGGVVAGIRQIGQYVEQSKFQVPISKQHVGTDELEQHKKWTVWQRKSLRVGVNKKVQTEKQQKILAALVLSFGNLSSFAPRPDFERRFLKEFEESLFFLVKTAFFSFELNLSN